MPCSRPEDLPQAIKVFMSQDYEDKELIIMGDEGFDSQIVSYWPEIHVYNLKGTPSIGYKRNVAIEVSEGSIIINADSDDWYAPDYITRCVNQLQCCDITGLSSAYFYKPRTSLWLYEYRGSAAYVLGSGMAYHKKVWERKPYKDRSDGEDLYFQENAGRIIPHGYIDGFMAMIHGKNTASHLQLQHMRPQNIDLAKNILGDMWNNY